MPIQLRESDELKHAVSGLRKAIQEQGWYLHRIERGVYHVCLDTGTPFYTVVIRRRLTIQRLPGSTVKETKLVMLYDLGNSKSKYPKGVVKKILHHITSKQNAYQSS